MTIIQNERTKLTANWLNALASGVIVTGVVAPSLAILFQMSNGQPVAIWAIGTASAICFLMGLLLHLCARFTLRRLT